MCACIVSLCTFTKEKIKHDEEKEETHEEEQERWLNDRQQTVIPCFVLAQEMEAVKSQRGAKSVAQNGTAHQNVLKLMKTLVINASASQI